MTAFANLRLNKLILLNGQLVRVEKYLPNGNIQVCNAVTGSSFEVTNLELQAAYKAGELDYEPVLNAEGTPATKAIDFDLYPERDKKEAKRRYAYGIRLQAHHDSGGRKVEEEFGPIIAAVAQEIGDRSPPNWKTTLPWCRIVAEAGGNALTALLPQHTRKGPQSFLTPITTVELIRDLAEKFFNTKNRRPKDTVWSAVRREVALINRQSLPQDKIDLPSRATVYRIIAQLPEYKAVRNRLGKKAADAKFKYVKQGVSVSRPNERWEIDNYKTDIFVTDDNGEVIGRLWATVVIDCYTRAIMGYYLSFDAPSSHSVIMALYHAILPKADEGYPFFGLPEVIVVDNGPDYRSEHLTQACQQLKIQIEYARPYTPEWKGKIERFFRTLSQRLFHQMPGTTRSNSKDRGEYNAVDEAMIVYHEAEDLLQGYLVNDYFISEHRRLKESPRERWEGYFKGNAPRLPANKAMLNVLLMKAIMKPVHRYGIEWEGMIYQSPQLNELKKILPEGKKVKMRYDPTNLTRIFVENPLTGEPLTVPLVTEDRLYGPTLPLHRKLRKAHNARRKNPERDLRVATYRTDVLEEVDRLAAKRKRRQKKNEKSIRERTHDAQMKGLARKSLPAPEWAIGPTSIEAKQRETYQKRSKADQEPVVAPTYVAFSGKLN